MRWTWIIMLPFAVSVFWIVAIIFGRRNQNRAQLFYMTTLTLDALSLIVLMATFRIHNEFLPLMDIFEKNFALFSGAIFFLGICAQAEAFGPRPKDRWVLVWPMLYVLAFLVIFLNIGRLGYEEVCRNVYAGNWQPHYSDPWMNAMTLTTGYVFAATTFVYGLVLTVASLQKSRIFCNRIELFYKKYPIGNTPFYVRLLCRSTVVFYVAMMTTYLMVSTRIEAAKTVLIIMSLVVAVVQSVRGYCMYKNGIDATWLANEVRKAMRMKSMSHRHLHSPNEPHDLGHEICRYVEQEGFADTDTDVFHLAMLFNVSQDEVVDSIFAKQGSSVDEYISSVRVEHAIKQLSKVEPDAVDDVLLANVAVNCGFTCTDEMNDAFREVMQLSLKQWVTGGGLALI